MKPLIAAFRNSRLSKWLPALLVMLIIFWFSSQPNYSLPNFHWADAIVKKGGHVTVYAFLALAYWYALDFKKDNRWIAWLLAILYAATDEFHQSFTVGRHPSAWDVLIFDNLGALISLWLATLYIKRKQPDHKDLVVEKPRP
jgi:VanZ family protein